MGLGCETLPPSGSGITLRLETDETGKSQSAAFSEGKKEIIKSRTRQTHIHTQAFLSFCHVSDSHFLFLRHI